jgi:hypothetical protein
LGYGLCGGGCCGGHVCVDCIPSCKVMEECKILLRCDETSFRFFRRSLFACCSCPLPPVATDYISLALVGQMSTTGLLDIDTSATFNNATTPTITYSGRYRPLPATAPEYLRPVHHLLVHSLAR